MKHELKKVYTITTLKPGVLIMACPKCGQILASGSERDVMPESAHCNGEQPKKIGLSKA